MKLHLAPGNAALAMATAALTLLAPAPAVAQRAGSLSASVLTPGLAADTDRLVAGKPFRLAVVADVKSGWHVNSHTPKEDFLIPTEVALQPSPGLTFGKPAYPPHKEIKLAFSDVPLAVYEGKTVVQVDGSVDAGAALGPRTLTALLSYQPCNDQQCLPPTKVQATLTIEVAKAGTAAKPANAGLFGPPGGTAKPAGPKADIGGGPPSPGDGISTTAALREKWSLKGVPTLVFLGEDGKERPERVIGFVPPEELLRIASGSAGRAAAKAADAGLAGKSLPILVLIVFFSGLALNLTPCVYPLIPITVGFFGRQSAGKTTRSFGLASAYVLGMSATYSALGVFAALSGSLFGAALQKPVVVVGIAVVVIALALSMFGLYEIQAPAFITDRTGSRSGVLGALSMGLFVGFVAAPCIGPFVLSLLTFVAKTGSALAGFGLFFTLSMGLGLPYLVLGTVSGSIQKLPRSGEWMVAVRKVFGFALVALAVYFLRPLIPERVYQVGMALPLVVGGLYFLLFEKQGHALRWFRGLKAAVALTFFAAGAVLALPQRKDAPDALVFQPYSAEAVAAAAAARRPVMIDFYADWCLPCKELDHKTFNDPQVVASMKGWTLLKADLTRE